MQGFTERFAMKSKLIAGGVVAVLAIGTAMGAFAAHGVTSVDPQVDATVTTTETVTATDTAVVEATATETVEATPTATESPAATETATETAEATATETETPAATETPSATETPEPTATALHDQSGCVKIAPHDHRELGGNHCGWQKHPEKHGTLDEGAGAED